MRILPLALLLLAGAPTNATAVAKEGQSLFMFADLQADAPFVFLPNVDDDSGRCAGPLAAVVEARTNIGDAARCHDAADTVVNGPEDAQDLTPLRVAAWPQAPDDATAIVSVTGNARLMRDGTQFGGTLTAAELRTGIELGVEGLDVARAPGTGGATFTLTVTAGGETATDTLTGEVAPVLFPSALEPPETLYARRAPTEKEVRARVAEAESVWGRLRKQMRSDPATVLERQPSLKRYRDDPSGLKRFAEREIRRAETGERDWQAFARGYKRTLQKAAPTRDFEGAVFAQDAFETGIAATPRGSIRVSVLAPGLLDGRLTAKQAAAAAPTRDFEGAVFAQDAFETGIAATPRGSIRVSVLAPGLLDGRLTAVQAAAAAWPFQELRGPGKAVVVGKDYDATGNFEATPPAPGAPLGKLLVGTTTSEGWPAFLAAQAKQPVVRVDTSKLAVGHVDELVAVIPTKTGWVLAVADPGQALTLAAGAKVDRHVRRESKRLVARLDALATRLKGELGAEVVRFPVLFGPGDGGLYAATGNAVNGVAVGNRTFLAADPHGPRRKGKDVFKAAIATVLEGRGVTLRWVDTMPFPHVRLGEVHCYTNAIRDPGALKAWWEVGGA